jgi:hypothetical protein
MWIKYCGVCDEYKILKSKWNYFCCDELSSLPPFGSTFRRVDGLIRQVDRFFAPFYERTKPDSTENFDPETALQRIRDLQNRFVELSNYVGILKFIFFQRTVSIEIPHNVSDVPTSPERTMGNEMLYMAADKIATRYRNCLNRDPNLEWDGAISFIYPIQHATFYGGYCRPSSFLKHFHISISEEGKHFLGSYLILAHEMAHASHHKWDGDSTPPRFRSPIWFRLIWDRIFTVQKPFFGERLEELEERCSSCEFFGNLCSHLLDADDNSFMFSQYFADLLAFMIGGPATFYSLTDMFLNSAAKFRYDPLRAAFLQGFFSEINDSSTASLFEREISWERSNWKSHVGSIRPIISCIENEADPSRLCFEFFEKIGFNAGRIFADCDKGLVNVPMIEIPASPPFPTGVDSITSLIVRDRFRISEEEEARIKENLTRQIACVDEDPRKILHCYYMLHRSGNTPEYATTLSSLASSRS